MLRQGGHRGPAHGLVRLPVLPLAVGVAVVGLGALPALGQVVAVLAAVETLEDGDPQGFGGLVFLRLRVLGEGLSRLFRGGAVVVMSWRGGGHFRGVGVVVVVARGTVVATSWLGAFRVVHRWIVKLPRFPKSGPDFVASSWCGGSAIQLNSLGLLPPQTQPPRCSLCTFSRHSPLLPFARASESNGQLPHLSHELLIR